MRLVTFKTKDGHAHVGVLKDTRIIDLNVWFSRQDKTGTHMHFDMVDFITHGSEALYIAKEALAADADELERLGMFLELKEEALLAPIPRPRKNVLCLGRNYPEHVAESVRAFNEGAAPVDKPDCPTIFTKAVTTVNAPFEDIPYDSTLTGELDWEVELALVIGKPGKNISRNSALQHIFGYMALNDISARDLQKRYGGQNFKGKSLDGACPTGPWIVTTDEIANPNDLRLTLRVNEVTKQDDRTSSMLFDIGEIIEHMSLGMTLEPGDIIATGTPAGVGLGRTPKEFLQPGDVIECEIEGIGLIRNRVVSIAHL
jgi:2-keto-4-pentenoate hydratase/2-oxohepta-3-ene-1,7-dioic acid hydratase in catechol pathway